MDAYLDTGACAARPPRPDNRKPLPRIPHV